MDESSRKRAADSSPASSPPPPKRRRVKRNALEEVCKSCGHNVLVTDSKEGMTTCIRCGLVSQTNMVSDEAEWRSFADDTSGSDPSRVGGPDHPLLAELGTMDASGDFGYASRAINSADSALRSGFSAISKAVKTLDLPKNVKDSAESFFKQVYDLGEIKGRSRDVVVAAIVFLAAKLENVPRPMKEVCLRLEQKKRTVTRQFNNLVKLNKAKRVEFVRSHRAAANAAERSRVEFFARDFANRLGLPPAVANAAEAIAKGVHDKELASGKGPPSVAGACVCLAWKAYHLPLTSRPSATEVANMARTSPGTIKAMFKALHKHREELVPAEYTMPKHLRQLSYNL